jgi:hypothetical protein
MSKPYRLQVLAPEDLDSQALALAQAAATADTAVARREAARALIMGSDPEYARYLERIPAAKRDRAHAQTEQLRHGLHALAPVTCLGPSECSWINHCPIPDRKADGSLVLGPASNYPNYQPCLLERQYMQAKIVDYLEHLEVDPLNPIEMALVNELAVLDLYKNRAMLILSEGDRRGEGRDLMKTDVTGFNDHGTESTMSALHPAADFLDRLEKRRERVIGQLGESRKHKAEMRARAGTQHADSAVLSELRAVREALEAAAKLPADPTDTLKLGD